MGYQSSIAITREDCLKEIFGRLLQTSNDNLCSVLDNLSRDRDDSLYFYNFYIVENYPKLNEVGYFEKDFRDI